MTPPHKTVREFWAVLVTYASGWHLVTHGDRVKSFENEIQADAFIEVRTKGLPMQGVTWTAVRVVETLEVKAK